jgi:hypothetical protein
MADWSVVPRCEKALDGELFSPMMPSADDYEPPRWHAGSRHSVAVAAWPPVVPWRDFAHGLLGPERLVRLALTRTRR